MQQTLYQQRAEDREVSSSEVVLTSRDEMNLAEFPLAVLSTRTNSKVKTLEFRDNQRLPSGEVIERQWIITGADKFGLPTATDDDVLLGLMRLTMDQGFRNRKVYFTRYELLGILRWTTEGRSYSRLTKSLDRLSGVRIRAANAFFDNASKAYQTRNFGIIDAYEINDGRGNKALSGAEASKSYFIWSEALFHSFKSGFIKKLDLTLYFSLRSAVSRRLYRYLDKHFYYKSSIEKPLVTFAFEKLGLSRSYQYISQIKQQIEPACEELKALGFLSSYEFAGRGVETVVRFHSGKEIVSQKHLQQTESPLPRNHTQQGSFILSSPPVFQKDSSQRSSTDLESQRQGAIEALLSRGIHLSQAKRLLSEKNAAELLQVDKIISYYDFLVQTNDTKVSKNRVGFLYRAVETPHKFIIPRSFEEKILKNTGRDFPKAPISSGRGEANPVEKKEYQEYLSTEVDRYRKTLSSESLSNLYDQVEKKMNCLKTALDRRSLHEAVEGCVREELAKKIAVVDFETWKRKRERNRSV